VSHEKVTDSHTRSSHEKLTRLTESHGSESQKVTESHTEIFFESQRVTESHTRESQKVTESHRKNPEINLIDRKRSD